MTQNRLRPVSRPFTMAACAIWLLLAVTLTCNALAPAETSDTRQSTWLLKQLHLRDADNPKTTHLGSNDPDDGYKIKTDISYWGAGIYQITLTDYKEDVISGRPYLVHHTINAPRPGRNEMFRIRPFSAKWISINDSPYIDLENAKWSVQLEEIDDHRQSVSYAATIVDEDHRPVLKISRRYTVTKGEYDLSLEQTIANLTDHPLQVVFKQYAQGDMAIPEGAYLGDRRMFVTGYFNEQYDPNHIHVFTDDGGYVTRKDLIDRKFDDIWPNEKIKIDSSLAWLASLNRYFTVVTHSPVTTDMQSTSDIPAIEQTFPHINAMILPPERNIDKEQQAVVFTLQTDPIDIEPGGTVDLNLAIYAGPRKIEIFDSTPYSLLNFPKLIRYELGCTWCTFQFLAKGLLWFLKQLHWAVQDWGISIIILVVVVRLILHPITKKSQINMMKMGKQMQVLQPEMEKIKQKYKDDQAKQQKEIMALYREKGMNPANMLGCLPMFLQMPIWVALYAMLYYAIELRHEPGFYGVFQFISGGHWHFLADLSTADHFIKLPGQGFDVPLIFITPHFGAINILPILMGVVFFFQQKFTSPPPANEQAAQQQKIMKIMTIALFPLLLYSAPSGLTLYILASTGAGVVDSYLVRKHIKEEEERGSLFDTKPRKKGGFFDRVNKMVEEKQKALDSGGAKNRKNRKKNRR